MPDSECPWSAGSRATPAGGSGCTGGAAARTLPECRSGSSRRWHGRAAPGSRAGPPRLRAGGWQTSAAGHAGRRPPRQARVAQPRPQPAAHVRGRQAAAALGEEQGRLVRRLTQSAGAPVRQVALERALGRLADRDDPRLGALAEHPQLLGVEVDRRRRRGSRSPRSAARRSRRARTSRGRAARAACAPGCGRAAAATSSVRSALGSGALPACVARRGRRGSGRAPRVRPCVGRTRGSRRTCARPWAATARARPSRAAAGEVRGVAAQEPVVDLAPARRPRPSAQRGELPDVAAVGAARLLGHAARGELAVEPCERVAPGAELVLPPHLRSTWDVLLHQRRDRPRRDPGQLDRGRRDARPHEPPALPWHPVQGPGDASTAVYSVLRKRVRGRERAAWIGTAVYSPRRPPGLFGEPGLARRSRSDEMRAGPRPERSSYWM